MAEYKLIKSYPGSPKIDTKVKPLESNLSIPVGYYRASNNILYNREEIENYPEFWQKIEESKYWFGVIINNWQLETYNSYKNTPVDTKLTKWFESELDRDNYIKINKPQYSEKDLLDCVKYVGSAIGSLSLAPVAVDNWIRNIKK